MRPNFNIEVAGLKNGASTPPARPTAPGVGGISRPPVRPPARAGGAYSARPPVYRGDVGRDAYGRGVVWAGRPARPRGRGIPRPPARV